MEDTQAENNRGNHFDMNHLIDWCQVSSVSALFLMGLLLQAVNSCVSKKEIWHCILGLWVDFLIAGKHRWSSVFTL